MVKRVWKVNSDYIQLSVFCNWRFAHLNEAFRYNWQVDDRLIYVYSDAVSSGIVGNQMEDLLRVIPYKRGAGCVTFHFEPKNIYYKAVRERLYCHR